MGSAQSRNRRSQPAISARARPARRRRLSRLVHARKDSRSGGARADGQDDARARSPIGAASARDDSRSARNQASRSTGTRSGAVANPTLEDYRRNVNMTDAEIAKKFDRACAFMKVPDAQRDRARTMWGNLREVKDIGDAIQTLATIRQPAAAHVALATVDAHRGVEGAEHAEGCGWTGRRALAWP